MVYTFFQASKAKYCRNITLKITQFARTG